VAEYLQRTAGIPKEHIAIKSSEKDDIDGLDLFSPSCPIRYIITKQALQEGWDCSFAYVLTILTNPTSKNNLTQLVGRILRQPSARKTGVKELDESYVFCFQQRGEDLLKVIKKGFESEGLGDLTTQIIHDGTDESASPEEGEKTVSLKKEFKKFAGNILLPVFVIKDDHGWRQVSYEADIISQIDWEKTDFTSLKTLPLEERTDTDTEFAIGLSTDEEQVIERHGLHRLPTGGLALDTVFIARHLLEVIPNPWIAYEIAQAVSDGLVEKHGINKVANELVFVIEELRKKADSEKDRIAHEIFMQMIKDKKLRFMIVRGGSGYTMPDKLKIKKSSRTLNRLDGQPLQYSLFDFVPEEQFNETEKFVAWYLEEQQKLLWWYRNISREDYSIQGWRKHKVYPDFIFSEISTKDRAEFDKVFVVETKGLHLKNNDDTKYKTKLFEYCNKLAQEKSLTDLGLSLKERKVVFEVISEDEWQVKLRELFKG
jgi:type III restriction enzyme